MSSLKTGKQVFAEVRWVVRSTLGQQEAAVVSAAEVEAALQQSRGSLGPILMISFPKFQLKIHHVQLHYCFNFEISKNYDTIHIFSEL